ncbi:hypothetical protein DM813_19625 [Pseudomonas alkylphenolica]|uniref:Uncharacterized protein n=1 Tax=Pseudomonas alkylphenolica TaxID=237609 RepID=A0A443ZQL6_9PSED|nr:hypothetical protein [Pseudomonas alkylphenolica]RWU21389.1 hypothetical protein DM813_19625 [Pseudomonas alkylphenolica]
MSTLNEIAMNHAKMVNRLAQESITLEQRQPLVVGGFEVSSLESPQPLPLPFLIDVPDRSVELIGATA